ncbi:MAG: multidrug efflux SMR transporter [Pseudomonadota bacterium]
MPIHYVYLLISVLAEAVGFSALNTENPFRRIGPSLAIIGGFGGAFYFLTLTLQHVPLGITYALSSGLGILVVALAGVILFGQRLDGAAILGLALIGAGIVLINALSNFAVH